MNRKGLATGIMAIMALMFIFAFSSLIALTMWSETTDIINGIDNNTVSQQVKDKIDGLTSRMLWADKLFVAFFVSLLISYLISSVTLPSEHPIFMFIFIGILAITCIVAMGLSNSWTWLIGHPVLSSASANLTFTNWFMRYLPIVTFFVGVAGAILFFSRSKSETEGVANFE